MSKEKEKIYLECFFVAESFGMHISLQNYLGFYIFSFNLLPSSPSILSSELQYNSAFSMLEKNKKAFWKQNGIGLMNKLEHQNKGDDQQCHGTN